MSHDELMEKIRGLDISDFLRFVLEIHKPFRDKELSCAGCSNLQNDRFLYDDMNIPYPCPTIQAIEKELK